MSFLLFAAAASLIVQSTAASDSCRRIIPEALRIAVERQYAGYQGPLESDNLAEDIKYNRDRGRSGCLGAAVGHYYGKKTQDYALLLTSRASGQVLLAVATGAGSSWRIAVLQDLGTGARNARSTLYVETVPPGLYKRTEALDGTVSERGELLTYTSKYDGVQSGTIESGAVAHFFTGQRWVHVWVSD